MDDDVQFVAGNEFLDQAATPEETHSNEDL